MGFPTTIYIWCCRAVLSSTLDLQVGIDQEQRNDLKVGLGGFRKLERIHAILQAALCVFEFLDMAYERYTGML
jgi:hypothetical protein